MIANGTGRDAWKCMFIQLHGSYVWELAHDIRWDKTYSTFFRRSERRMEQKAIGDYLISCAWRSRIGQVNCCLLHIPYTSSELVIMTQAGVYRAPAHILMGSDGVWGKFATYINSPVPTPLPDPEFSIQIEFWCWRNDRSKRYDVSSPLRDMIRRGLPLVYNVTQAFSYLYFGGCVERSAPPTLLRCSYDPCRNISLLWHASLYLVW